MSIKKGDIVYINDQQYTYTVESATAYRAMVRSPRSGNTKNVLRSHLTKVESMEESNTRKIRTTKEAISRNTTKVLDAKEVLLGLCPQPMSIAASSRKRLKVHMDESKKTIVFNDTGISIDKIDDMIVRLQEFKEYLK